MLTFADGELEPKQIEIRLAIHASLQTLQPIDVTFHSIVPFENQT